MKILSHFISKDTFARNVGLLVGSAAIGQIVAVLAAPILSRLYTPDDFGVWGVYVSLFAVLNGISSLRYEFMVNLAEDDDLANYTMGLTLSLVVATSIITLLLVIIVGQFVANLVNAEELGQYLWLLPFSLLGAGIFTAFNYWSLRYGNFNILSRARVFQNISNVAIALVLGFLVLGPVGLMLGHACSQIFSGSLMGRMSRQKQSKLLVGISKTKLLFVASKYKRMALFTTGSALLNNIGQQLPRLLVSTVYGIVVTGWFTLSLQIYAIPLSLIGASVGQVFLSKSAEIIRNDKTKLYRFYLKTALLLLLLSIPPTVIISLFGKELFVFVFSAEWEVAGKYAQIMAPAFMIQFIVAPLSQIMFVIGRAKQQLLWDLFRVIAISLVFIIASFSHLTDIDAITLYSSSLIVTYALLFIIHWKSLNSVMKEDLSLDETTSHVKRTIL